MASTIDTGGSGSTARRATAARADTSESGWVTFAGTMILLIGILNFIYGIAAIDNSRFFVGDASFVFSDLNTWGWFLLVVGIIQVAAGLGIYAGSEVARWVGIASAAVNALIQMFILPAYPLWALAVFAVDVLILYALLAHGGRRTTAA